MNKVNEIFSKNLCDCLRDKKMTAITLAKKLNVSASIICEWMKGNKFPRSERLEQLANILEMPIYWFFEEEHKKTRTIIKKPIMGAKISTVNTELKRISDKIDRSNELLQIIAEQVAK